MTEKFFTETIKSRTVEYTVRFYSKARYYYLHSIDHKPVATGDPFPNKQCMIDFVASYKETDKIELSIVNDFIP